jgi:hypothetical protein
VYPNGVNSCLEILRAYGVVLQIGDGSYTQRNTPVSVVGLSTGVANVAVGYVRLCFIAER